MTTSLNVVEMGGIAAGYAGRLFAEAGHGVTRATLTDAADPWQQQSWSSDQALALYLHAGKTPLALPQAELTGLVDGADIVICEADTSAAIDALRFAAINARVKIAITPFGRTGPRRNWRATSHTLLAYGGYTYLMGDPDRAPLSLPGHYLEFQSGALAYMSALAALQGNAASDQSVDIAMLDTLLSLSQFTSVRYHCTGEVRQRHGSDFHFVTPSDLFACADGWVYVNIVPAFWDAFTLWLERPELLVDPRFADNDRRIEHKQALHQIVAAAVASQSTAELGARAESCRVPIGILHTLQDVLDCPHLDSRGFGRCRNH